MNSSARKDSVRHDSTGFQLVVSSEYSERIRAEGWTNPHRFDEMMAQARRVTGGRGPNWILEWTDTEERIRVRPCRRGGVLGSMLGDRSWSASRVLREFTVWTTLRQQKIPLPVPVLAVSRRQGFFWRSAFASIECQNARNGFDWLEGDPPPVQLAAMCISFARSLRQLHDAGAIHGDLQLRNVLIESDTSHAHDERVVPRNCMFIDLDRTRIVDCVSARQRIQELLRFARSLEKTGHKRLANRRFRALALSAYCAGDRSLRRSMIRWSRLETLGILRHRMAWRFSRLTR